MIKLALNVMFRPLDAFYDLKYHGKGQIRHALILLTAAYVSSVIGVAVTAFPFQATENELSSLGIQAVRVLLPWVVWVSANYAVSTIMLGEGS